MKNSIHNRIGLAALALCVLMCAVFVCGACSSVKGETKRLENNVARIYDHEARISHFYLNENPVGDDVSGMAMMSTSADGLTSLAWVGSTLYFVSEKGTDKLATGVDTAELSFDGQVAVWFEDGQIKKYTLSDRSTTVLAEGVSSLVQLSISPNSKTMLITVTYDDFDGYAMLIADGSGVRELSRSMIGFAVSDDADIMYYYDSETKGLTVKKGDEVHLISKKCTSATNYNFTNDLSEMTYTDSNNDNHLFCLDTKSDTVIGNGFGVTEKTDIFSISTVTFFTYINDTDSFRSGLWSVRRTVDSSYIYDVGYIDASGSVSWIAKDATKFYTTPDQSRVYWIDLTNSLKTAKCGKNDKAKTLADSVLSFDELNDGSRLYYITASGSLFTLKGAGKGELVSKGVSRFAVMGERCAYITSDGFVHYAEGKDTFDVGDISGAVRFDKRSAALMLYVNERSIEDGTLLYDVYMTSDGAEYKPVCEGVEP